MIHMHGHSDYRHHLVAVCCHSFVGLTGADVAGSFARVALRRNTSVAELKYLGSWADSGA